MNCRLAQLRTVFLLLLAAGAGACVGLAQTVVTPPVRRPGVQAAVNFNVVVLDPAHGGVDAGAKLGGAGLEKDLNLVFVERLRGLLTQRGFSVVLTRTDGGETVLPDQRAEIANRARAVACLIVHMTSTGQGVHLFTSSLASSATRSASNLAVLVPEPALVLWETAQAGVLLQATELASALASPLNDQRIPVIEGSASVRPMDSMVCPAVALEIGPATPDVPAADEGYQQRLAESIAGSLEGWRQLEMDRAAEAEVTAQRAAAQRAATAAAEPGATAAGRTFANRPPVIRPPLPVRPPTPPSRMPVRPPAAPARIPPAPSRIPLAPVRPPAAPSRIPAAPLAKPQTSSVPPGGAL